MNEYFANSANCLGSERSTPGIPSRGIFLAPVTYSLMLSWEWDEDDNSSSILAVTISSVFDQLINSFISNYCKIKLSIDVNLRRFQWPTSWHWTLPPMSWFGLVFVPIFEPMSRRLTSVGTVEVKSFRSVSTFYYYVLNSSAKKLSICKFT